MRTLVALCCALLALPLAAAAQPGTSSALTLSVSSSQAVYGHPVLLSGRLSGSHAAGRAVALDAWPYGAAAAHRLAVVTTDGGGAWTYRAHPAIQTAYQANGPGAMSARVTVGVHPAITVTRLANGRLRASVHAGHSFTGRFVQLQTGNADGSWTTVDRKRLSRASQAVLTPPAGTGDVRVAMSVNQSGAGYLGATSRRVSFEVGPVSLSALCADRPLRPSRRSQRAPRERPRRGARRDHRLSVRRGRRSGSASSRAASAAASASPRTRRSSRRTPPGRARPGRAERWSSTSGRRS